MPSGVVNPSTNCNIFAEHGNRFLPKHVTHHCNSAGLELCIPVGKFGSLVETDTPSVLVPRGADEPTDTRPQYSAETHSTRFGADDKIVSARAAVSYVIPIQYFLCKHQRYNLGVENRTV